MLINIIGVKNVSFTDKESGRLVEYVELHITTKDKYVEGMRTQILKCSKDKIINLKVPPQEAEVIYDATPNGKAIINKVTCK